MARWSRNSSDRPTPFERFDAETEALVGLPEVPLALRYFGGAGIAHMQKYGTRMETFAEIRAKASRHAARNPLALFRKEVTADEVMASPVLIPGVMTRLMACPPTCGAAAALVVSEDFATRRGLAPGVRIAAQAMTTDTPSTFAAHDMMRLVGYDMARAAAQATYEAAGIGPEDVDVVELHDCFAQNELISYEALGLCPEGGGEKFVRDGDNTYGGKVVTNPSGGLLSKGHPLGATGLAQCFELTQQLRGTAGERQVAGARIALQHNLGLGGACVTTLYRARVARHLPPRPFPAHPIIMMNARLSRPLILAACALAVAAGGAFAQTPVPAPAPKAATPPAPPWPRVVDLATGQALVYQPQVTRWQDNQLEFRAALAYKVDGAKDQAFGVLFATARTARRPRHAHRGARGPADHAPRLSHAARPRRRLRGRAHEDFAAKVRTMSLDRAAGFAGRRRHQAARRWR